MKKVTLLDFLEVERKKREKPQRDVTEEVYNFVKQRGVVKKGELAKWAKERGIPVAELIRAIEKLAGEKKIRKKLDDEGDLVYEA